MIKSGYYKNKENRNLLKSCDLDLAYQNMESPMLEDVKKIVKTINY
jgi:hypothetical protein